MKLSTQSIKHNLTLQPQNQVFYRQLSEDEAKIVTDELIECLKIFDRICRINGLVYLIVAGGLIGAVREGKILSWDDDIDIVMPREDYRRFKEEFEKSEYVNDYCFKYPEDNSVITMGAHFFNKNHSLTDLISENIGNSLVYESYSYLDIVPLDYCNDNNFIDKLKGTLTNVIQMGYISRRCFKRNDPFLNYLAKQSLQLRINLLIRKIFSIPFLLVPKKVLFKQLDFILDSKKKTRKMTISYGARRYFGEQMAAEVFLPAREMAFSGITAMVPNDSHKYLEHRYGNYMRVPSKEERNTNMFRLRGDWENYIKR